MINATSSAASAQPAAQSTETSAQKPAKPEQQPATTDSVQLSNAAQASLAALKELRETSAQTVQEAGKGDHQAQRLLAKEAAKQAK